MIPTLQFGHRLALFIVAIVCLSACAVRTGPMNHTELTEFATRYAAAWSSQDPDKLAAHYADNGTLVVNEGTPSVGREQIAAKARGFMTAFPDMVVRMESVTHEGNRATFHWRWTGTNTGPGGNGRSVDLRGYEEWTLDSDGLIIESNGHYDESEYERQMNATAEPQQSHE